MYNPGENLSFDKDFVDDPNHRTSANAHFYEKLLNLNDNMNTSTGKRLGDQRHKTMINFLQNGRESSIESADKKIERHTARVAELIIGKL